MCARKSFLLGFTLLASVALAQTKQPKTAQLLVNAQYVYIEPLIDDGTFANPNVSPEDRQAVTDISNAIEKWGRYKLAARRSDAELIISVRKGRVASNSGDPDGGPQPRSVGAAIGYLALLGLASPFLDMQNPIHGIIGLVILSVGLRIAWRLTAGSETQILGPYESRAPAPAVPA